MPWFSLESGVQLSKMNLTEDDSSEEDILIHLDTQSDVSTFASKATEKRNKKYKLNNPEEGAEDDVSDLTTKSQDTKLTKMQESIASMEGKLAASLEENEKLQKQLKEKMAELAKKKLSPESLVSQGMNSNSSTLTSSSSQRSKGSKRNSENKILPQAKRSLISATSDGSQKQEESMVTDIDVDLGKVTRSGKIIGPIKEGSRPGEAQVSPGTT